MREFLFLILIIFCKVPIYANDGAYFASGNQLIPIQETDISVQKEILNIKKINNQFIEVSVYYEFINPGADKEIIVGFEAMSPQGDVDGAPKKGLHPYMHNFTVNMNGNNLKYQVSYVKDSLYAQQGRIKSIDLKNFDGNTSGNYVDFFYVYHFNAKFKKGKNIIKHTYKFDVSGSVDYHYDFEYVLTAANRWANKQIDDFTLNVDMGNFEEFDIQKTFFTNNADWKINGIGKKMDVKGSPNGIKDKDAVTFYVQDGSLTFHKKNFKPKGELFIYSLNTYLQSLNNKEIDFYLPFSIHQQEKLAIDEPVSSLQRKIFRNLPFARRGFVFQDKDLKNYYERLDWYMPNPAYVADSKKLSLPEQKWISKWKAI